MSRHLGPLLSILLLGTEAARAADGAAPDDLRATGTNAWGARGRLELRGAFARHDQTVTAGADRTSAAGSAVSHLGASGAWMAPRLPLGVAAALDLDRFSLRSADAGAANMPVTGLETSVGLLARLGGAGATAALEGQLGYGFARVPILEPPARGAPMPMTTFAATPAVLQGHGPALAARLTVAVTRGLDLEATARALPLLFGARGGGASVDLRRYAGGAGAHIGLGDIGMANAGGMRLAALVGYEADVVDGEGAALAVHQMQHRIGLGLRASLVQAPPPAPVKAPAPPVAVAAAPPAARPVVKGVVRKAGEDESPAAALAGVSVAGPGGLAVSTDADGRFELTELPPGLAELRFSHEGFEDKTEVVAVPAQGEVVLTIRLRPVAAPRAAELRGQVRTEDGAPVAAQVRVLELGLSVRADAEGRFRFDVPPGRYTLTIQAPGFVSQRKAAPVGAGEQNIFNVDLQRQR